MCHPLVLTEANSSQLSLKLAGEGGLARTEKPMDQMGGCHLNLLQPSILISIASSSSQSETRPEKPQSQPCYNSLRRDVRLAGAVEERTRSKRWHARPSGGRRGCVAPASQLGRSGQSKTRARFRKARRK